MSNSSNKPKPKKDPIKLAKALRANLLRRKAIVKTPKNTNSNEK